MRLTAFLVLGTTLALSAQSPARKTAPKPAAAAPKAWPIESISVAGNRNYTAEQVLQAAGLRRGQMAGEAEFERARQRLLDSGAFETIGYKFDPAPGGNGIVARIDVAEIQQVYPVRFERMPGSPAELSAALAKSDPLFGPKIPGTKQVIDRYVRTLEQHLAAKGSPESLTGSVVVADGSEELVVVFRSAAAVPVIAEVKFTGNQAIPSTRLQGEIARVAIGQAYSESRMRQILDASIRPLYETQGFIRVAFPKITATQATDVKGLAVEITVEEGGPYKLGAVQVIGSPAPEKVVMKEGAFALGETVNFTAVSQGVERIHTLIRRGGYMRVDSKLERKIDDKEKRVDLTLHVDRGPQFTMGKLQIEGLDIHGEAAIKRLWTLAEGKPFDAGYPDFFLSRIREDGVFDNLGQTRSKIAINDKTQTVDVTLSFAGEKRAAPKKQF